MFRNPFSFEGRIRRREYGISLIIFVIALIIIVLLDASAGSAGGHSIIILFISPSLWFISAQGTKRCQDIGSNGWFQLLPFFLIWLIFEDGQDGANQYGENVKGVENSNQQNILDLKNSADEEPNLIISKERTDKIGKHKWLHPTDGFGKMEEGLADDGRRRYGTGKDKFY